ncbi:hypothetical protein AJ79_09592 [Helicocarpus griseus UAMH5409]|uniref:DJ-1/PfpI domain-containing protein n=1 Tax=Helicocarpus griseus UAMH5409 TaxID=1447875 RepID=A0A2B7WIV2_9EURO|nr:hypothetical protein AJ79_09592 [Helicocarpus griseus UAMH5409]
MTEPQKTDPKPDDNGKYAIHYMKTTIQLTAFVEAPPKHYAALIFPGFQALDLFGPLDILNLLGKGREIKLSLIGPTMDPVSTDDPEPNSNKFNSTSYQSVVPTHTYETAPKDIEVLLLPGGAGTRHDETVEPVIKFVADIYPKLRYLLTVCTGSSVAARAGILDGKNATTNKLRFQDISKANPQVQWKQRARWVVDGNIWTSSGISAGIDNMLAFVEHAYNRTTAKTMAKVLEYEWNENSEDDPFWQSALPKAS